MDTRFLRISGTYNALVNLDFFPDVNFSIISPFLLILGSNDNSSLAIVNVKLVGAENYKMWATAMKTTLKGKNKMGFIDGTCMKQESSDVLSKQLERCNAIVLGWILGSLSQELYVGQVYSEIVFEVWFELKETYDKMDGSVVFNMMHKINNLKQGDLSVPDYYHKLNSLWREFDILTILPTYVCEGRTTCTCYAKFGSVKHTQLIRLMQFLMGLNDIYQPIRSTILAKDPLPNVMDAFYVVSREESHRGLHPSGSSANKSQPTAFVSKTNNNTNNFYKRVNTNNNNKNVSRGPNPNLTCTDCGLIGHTVDICYELIGYPAGFKRNPNLTKQSRNNNKRFNANSEFNQSVPSTSGSLSCSFTREQMMKLLSLINEKPSPTSNMSDMFNVVDISSLMFTVGHPNGTLAKITAIGSLRLTSGIVLFDVLVIPEYNDLSLGKIMGTSSESGGLYLFDIDKIGKSVNAVSNSVFACYVSSKLWHCRLGHPVDQVLSILGKQLGFSKKDHISPCDICHKAKQTREPFPLSDHKSKFVGDIVLYDVLGPYRVVSLLVLSGVSPYFLVYGKDPGDTSNEDGNIGVTSDGCDNTVEDEVTNVATQIEENVTSEGNVQINQNGEGLSSVLGTSPMLRRCTRQKVLPAKFNDFVVNSSVRYGLEKYAMNLEMEAFHRNNTYVLTYFPPGRKAIGCKWIWKIKYKSSGEIDRYKARLVAKGFSQREGIDYEETFSPVVKMVVVRCLIALSVQNNWPLYQLDVNNAFLYEDLNEEVYMKLPPGYYNKNETKVCKLIKSLYGLKQAPRQWNEKLTKALIENGFVQSKNDYSLYFKSKDGIFIAILVYVDDIVITRNNENEIDKFKKFLSSKFMIKDLESENDKFLLNMTSRHMHAPLQSHFTAALRVLRYLKNAPGTGVQFHKESEYRCLASTTYELIWVVKILKDLEVDDLLLTHLYCDSISAISIAGNPVFHKKTKHFKIDIYLVRENVTFGVVKVLKVASGSNVADIFIKGLSIAQHNEFCNRLVDMFKP
ncbi:ribonuclease H-like domain-containing protein [Tanacetum coccineum]|uniref:Ribonuclease H-like domain-containing protein n=1 Tax=Tanacetum coccineum TaxID=301880 RepID=A0ABQ5C2N7_9ASTR